MILFAEIRIIHRCGSPEFCICMTRRVYVRERSQYIDWPKCCLTNDDWFLALRGITPTRKTRGVPARIAPAGSAVDRFEESPTGDADSPREIWWTVSRNYTVLILSRDIKNTKFNQYLPVDLTSLNVSNSRFRKPVMFWRWRHHGVALWRHGRGAGDNCLLLTTASNVKCWADVADHMTRLWQAGDTENFERRIMG